MKPLDAGVGTLGFPGNTVENADMYINACAQNHICTKIGFKIFFMDCILSTVLQLWDTPLFIQISTSVVRKLRVVPMWLFFVAVHC